MFIFFSVPYGKSQGAFDRNYLSSFAIYPHTKRRRRRRMSRVSQSTHSLPGRQPKPFGSRAKCPGAFGPGVKKAALDALHEIKKNCLSTTNFRYSSQKDYLVKEDLNPISPPPFFSF